MINRYDINEVDLKRYPQYYKFIENKNGRFVLWEDVKHIIEPRCTCSKCTGLKDYYEETNEEENKKIN